MSIFVNCHGYEQSNSKCMGQETTATWWEQTAGVHRTYIRRLESASEVDTKRFSVIHFRGTVEYDGANFAEANKRRLPSDIRKVLQGSRSQWVGERKGIDVAQSAVAEAGHNVSALCKVMHTAQIATVWCVLSNKPRVPWKLDAAAVVQQLLMMAVPDAVAFDKQRFAAMLSPQQFYLQYRSLRPKSMPLPYGTPGSSYAKALDEYFELYFRLRQM
jgi:myosin heavy subunit